MKRLLYSGDDLQELGNNSEVKAKLQNMMFLWFS